ncbi:phosphoglycolate phosphatase [Rhodovulum imhoffii]|uniref:Phosphoglycolate phosphatase n=1 Tax=Rhodovulum imhoffii TaxID=365340 RepID=A0A2T5BPR5_9RHOB|nr:phosphoglycolate phosphatase [Rhodovulum imhoffii]MBK5933086.1 phosphoglycolate phosphatase [Rhodovulum imhoffii]PTN01058.1 phosphoglycolate phosphatase [Rhodovulum imhoffii]
MSGLIFDLDGTLIDSAPDVHAAVNKTLEEIGTGGLPLEQVRGFIGNGVGVLMERVIAAKGLSQDAHASLLSIFRRHYDADPATLTTLYPNVAETVAHFHAMGLPLGICTNKPEAPTRTILESFGFLGAFDSIVGGDSTSARKPDPVPLLTARDRLGVTDVIYIGDSEVDAECAQRAGLPFALFSGGYHRQPLDELPQSARFDDFAELPAIIARLLAETA